MTKTTYQVRVHDRNGWFRMLRHDKDIGYTMDATCYIGHNDFLHVPVAAFPSQHDAEQAIAEINDQSIGGSREFESAVRFEIVKIETELMAVVDAAHIEPEPMPVTHPAPSQSRSMFGNSFSTTGVDIIGRFP